MKVRIIGPLREVLAWQIQVENLGEDWRCVAAGEELLLLLPGREGKQSLRLVAAHPPIAPPYILGEEAPDGPLPPVERLVELTRAWRRAGVLPALAAHHLPMAERLSMALLRTLDASKRLRAWAFLPQMCALTVIHPPLLMDLQHGLYPLVARETGMTPSGVERSMRLWVESAWMHGDLDAIDRLFGASVDPEKGKPTNREFLCRVAERVTLAMERLV